MAIHSLSDLNKKSETSFNDSYSIISTPKDYVVGNGLVDRYRHLETLPSYLKRHLTSTQFWFRSIIYLFIQYCMYKIEFGQMFFMASCLYFMYKSLGKREDDIRSAYAVFNKGKEIHGGMSAKEFDKQLRGGGL